MRVQTPPAGWADVRRLGLLALLAAAVHVAVISHTEVAARDSIGFIRTALQLAGNVPPSAHAPERLTGLRSALPTAGRRWLDVITTAEHPPGYPIALAAVSVPVRRLFTLDDADCMVLAAQVTSALAAVLLVVPVYLAGRLLFNARVGFAAAALFQCLPVALQVTSDGLSEGVFLLAYATAFWLGVRAVRVPSAWGFASCGLAAGLAYLVRPEGALVAVAVGLLAAFLAGTRRPGWSAASWAPAALAGFLAVGGPYMLLIGGFTNKPTGNRLLNLEPTAATPAAPKVPLATVWAEWAPPQLDEPRERLGWGASAVAKEWLRSTHYGAGVLAVLGLVWYWRRLGLSAPLWVPLVVGGMQAALLWYLAVKVGYVSERHTVPLVLLSCFFAAAALPVVGHQAARLLSRWWPMRSTVATGVALFVLLVAGGEVTTQTLHANRAGHHEAGRWLACHADPEARIFDPYCWAHYYAGAVFREGRPETPGRPVVWYVVLERSKNPHLRLPAIPDAEKLAAQGRPVWEWIDPVKGASNKVVVFRVGDH